MPSDSTMVTIWTTAPPCSACISVPKMKKKISGKM